MASPAKRRKKNTDNKSSPAAPRGLDFFFAKPKTTNATAQELSDGPAQQDNGATTGPLSDEQLAKKLQTEWDKEDIRLGAASASGGPIVREPEQADVERSEISHVEDLYGGAQAQPHTYISQDSANTAAKCGQPSLPAAAKNTLSLQSAGSAEDTISGTIPFDESPLTFDPSKYVADLQSHWAAEGGNASYALLTRCFVLVNSTQSRIKIVDTLVNLLRTIIESDPDSLLPTVCICTFIIYFISIHMCWVV